MNEEQSARIHHQLDKASPNCSRTLELTSVSYGTLCSIAKKAGCFVSEGAINQYSTLDVILDKWRTFVCDFDNSSWNCWQDAWLSFVAHEQVKLTQN